MKKILLSSLLLFIVCAPILGQETESKISWQHFVNVDFELSIPVSKTNIRPVTVPNEMSLARQMLQTVEAFDLIAYNGSNEEFFCTIQVTAFANHMSMEGIATKLMQQLKSNYEEFKGKDKLHENIERIGSQRKLHLAYRGYKEHYSVIMYINERRVITILLSDVSDNQKWTKQFLDAFQLI